MKTCKSCFVSLVWGVFLASVLTSAFENALCWWVDGSLSVSYPMQTKKMKDTHCISVFLIYKLKLAVRCFLHLCAMPDF